MSSNTPAIRPHVEIVNGHLQTNSFKIAEHFGKNHKDVLRAIDGLECSHAFRERNFAPTQTRIPIHNGGHRYIKAYTLTRDGFTFLAMGFTGKEAAKWKEAYIEAFNRMEAALKQPEKIREPLDAFITMHSGMQSLAGQRYLVTFNEDGTGYRAKPVPFDCCVMTIEQFVKSLSDFNVVAYPNLLTDLVEAVANRVKRQMEYSKYMEQQVIDARARGRAL